MGKLFILISMMIVLNGKDILNFSPLPMESATKTLEIFTPMINYLEKKTGKKINIVYKVNNLEVMEGLKNKQIDIAYFGPLPYAKLLNEYEDVIPIVQYLESNGEKTYDCTMFKRKDVNIDLQNMKNKKLALTHKYSTCGYVFAKEVLSKYGTDIDKNSFKYLASHYEAIFEVNIGEYDLGFVKSSIFDKFSHLDVEVIDKGRQNPGLMIVANSGTLSLQEIKEIQNLLIDIPNDVKNSWDSKIKKDVVKPDIIFLNEYVKQMKDIELKDETK